MAGLVTEALARDEEVSLEKVAGQRTRRHAGGSGKTEAESRGAGRRARGERFRSSRQRWGRIDVRWTIRWNDSMPKVRPHSGRGRAVLRKLRNAAQQRLRTTQHAEQSGVAVAYAGGDATDGEEGRACPCSRKMESVKNRPVAQPDPASPDSLSPVPGSPVSAGSRSFRSIHWRTDTGFIGSSRTAA